MKKIILLVFLSLFFVACGGPSDKKILDDFYNTLEIPSYVEQNIDLKTSYTFLDQTIEAKWESSDEEILSNTGEVFPVAYDQSVVLTLTLKLNNTEKVYTFNLEVAGIPDEIVGDKILSTITIPEVVSDHLDLPATVSYRKEEYKIRWNSKSRDYINNAGHITFQPEDVEAILTANIRYNSTSVKKDFKFTIKKFDTSIMENYLNGLKLDSISDDIELTQRVTIDNKDFSVQWESSNTDVLTNSGKVYRQLDDTTLTLKATMSIDKVVFVKEYQVTVLKADAKSIMKQFKEIYAIPNKVTRNLLLPTDLLYDIKGTWTSTNPNIISNDGIINQNIKNPTNVGLTLTFTYGGETMSHTFSTSAVSEQHMFIDSSFAGEKENLVINEKGKLTLKEGALKGTYYSGQIDSLPFSEAVASWAATSSTSATCELMVSLRVDGVWSDYITYGKWGLGLHNAGKDQSNKLISLSTDEILVNKDKSANGFQFKLILERKDANVPSSVVSLIALALDLNNYKYDIDKSNLKQSVHYDVPRLYQHDVPGIGGIICSATSSTMLLKYHGHDFSGFNILEHEHIAGLVKDYGHNIYGNWVFNTVGIGAFGEKSYVKRFFGNNEFFYSLQELGPMACSIRGDVEFISTVTGNKGSYHTNGHLLVATGYEITDTETYVFINDPNAKGVSIKMTLANFNKIWRGVSYIVE